MTEVVGGIDHTQRTAGIGASGTSKLGATNNRSEPHNGHALQPTNAAEVAPKYGPAALRK